MKVKTIEIEADTIINGARHFAGDVVEVVEHWADFLIENKAAKSTSKKPTCPSPTPASQGAKDSTTAKAAEASKPAGGTADGSAGGTGADAETQGK